MSFTVYDFVDVNDDDDDADSNTMVYDDGDTATVGSATTATASANQIQEEILRASHRKVLRRLSSKSQLKKGVGIAKPVAEPEGKAFRPGGACRVCLCFALCVRVDEKKVMLLMLPPSSLVVQQ